ncbi:MAG: hypothetical protein LBH01_06455 [Verrucomicrobiales bacterium]|jgi:hypothetical protein|nr:hypothetical protein [Verrucomicrobiales bacterium]
MQIPVVKTKLLIVCGVGLIVSSLLAQTSPQPPALPQSPQAPANTSTDANSMQNGKSTSDAAASTTSSGLDYMFNRKPQEGTFAKDAMDTNQQAKVKMVAQDAIGGNRIEDPNMRLRFEKYLGMPEVSQEQLKAYSDDYNNVLQLLRQKKIADAWQQLYKLAQYDSIDAGISGELANRIESIWNADKTNLQLSKANDRLRKDIDSANRNADFMSDDIRNKDIDYQRRMKEGTGTANNKQSTQPNGGVPMANQTGDGGAASSPSVDSVMGKLQLTEEYLTSLELKAKIKMNELKSQKLFDKTKDDFAEYITALYKSGNQREVILAAEFWRNIFDQGDYPVSMAQQVNDSLETARETQNTVDVFNHSLEQKDIAAATDRLQEAFMLNELHPAVLGLPRVKKRPIEVFTRTLARIQNMIEARDFTNLESTLAEMKNIAPDFDTTKPMAIVNAVKLESQLRLGKAKLAAQQGDLKQAMEEFQAAAEAWPGNPDLKDKALTFFNSQDVQTQSLTEFDRLVAEDNYRAIFDKQLYFAPAMKDDSKRQDQLKAEMEKYKTAETAIQKASLLRVNGDVCGAWETVELTIKDLPNDIKLNTLRADLAGQGAEFVSAINKARGAESRKELGYSLTWYAIAQRYYPASQIANQAMDRLSKQILSSGSL